jgi:hypothetical protein
LAGKRQADEAKSQENQAGIFHIQKVRFPAYI